MKSSRFILRLLRLSRDRLEAVSCESGIRYPQSALQGSIWASALVLLSFAKTRKPKSCVGNIVTNLSQAIHFMHIPNFGEGQEANYAEPGIGVKAGGLDLHFRTE